MSLRVRLYRWLRLLAERVSPARQVWAEDSRPDIQVWRSGVVTARELAEEIDMLPEAWKDRGVVASKAGPISEVELHGDVEKLFLS